MATTTIMSIDVSHPQQRCIAKAVTTLCDGNLVVAPTETQYGLLARADDPEALDRMISAKRRPASMPVAVFLLSVQRIPQFADVSKVASALAKKYLPGPLTLVLTDKSNLPAPCVQNKKIGIRVSSSSVISHILSRVAFPVTATSANISGNENPGGVNDIITDLRDTVSLFLDAGILSGKPSTVVDCTTDPIVILREGVISRNDIEAVAGRAG
jgi:L-threonylcarbamoyladenylate synthase